MKNRLDRTESSPSEQLAQKTTDGSIGSSGRSMVPLVNFSLAQHELTLALELLSLWNDKVTIVHVPLQRRQTSGSMRRNRQGSVQISHGLP